MSAKIIEKMGGWKFHLLTEDIEFSTYSILHGERIAYCPTAMLYDEQPSRSAIRGTSVSAGQKASTRCSVSTGSAW